jgi:glycogen synthase
MRILMFGWEFPPFKSGGLGTACYGLTRGLSTKGVEIVFVLPSSQEVSGEFMKKFVFADKVKIRRIDSKITPYMGTVEYSESINEVHNGKKKKVAIYGNDLFEEIERYAVEARRIAMEEDFDIIHAHDWMTYKAGIEAKKVSGKPLIVQVHATEFDRTGDNPNQGVYDIEKYGLQEADKIIAVSNYTKQKIIEHYGINSDKISVVYNAVEQEDKASPFKIKTGEKIVLFLGRITLQKGPDYFVETANRVLKYYPNVKFVISGSGDMHSKMVRRVAELGIGHKVLFTGFLSGDDVDKAYKMADVYVMPSVSEPFGITPLEAIKNGTPVIISKQSGVSEILKNALKVDFWDIDELTNKIIAVLHYPPLSNTLLYHAKEEVKQLTWEKSAERCIEVYNEVYTKWKNGEYNYFLRGKANA